MTLEFLTLPHNEQRDYPSTLPAGLDYLKRFVKLELGSLTDQRPTGRHPVSPWLADSFPATFSDLSDLETQINSTS